VNYNSLVVTITVTCNLWAPSSGDHLFACGAIYLLPLVLISVRHGDALKSPHPIHTADGHNTRNISCITPLWLHHNHKISISYYKNGSVSCHQSVGRWFI